MKVGLVDIAFSFVLVSLSNVCNNRVLVPRFVSAFLIKLLELLLQNPSLSVRSNTKSMSSFLSYSQITKSSTMSSNLGLLQVCVTDSLKISANSLYRIFCSVNSHARRFLAFIVNSRSVTLSNRIFVGNAMQIFVAPVSTYSNRDRILATVGHLENILWYVSNDLCGSSSR